METLNKDVITIITRYCDTYTLIKYASTCKHLHNFLDTPRLWQWRLRTDYPDYVIKKGNRGNSNIFKATYIRCTVLNDIMTNHTELVPDWALSYSDLEMNNATIALWHKILPMHTIPKKFFILTNLANLSIRDTRLDKLPSHVSCLTNLRELVLMDNELTLLPDELCTLTQLETLQLTGNCLTELPENIGQLSNLKILCPADNHLTTLPDSFVMLTKLTLLSLQSNKLTTLPHNIGNMTNVTMAWLNSNPLFELPDSIGNLQKMEYMNICGTYITKLPYTFSRLKKLQSVAANCNIFHSIFRMSDHLTSLIRVTLMEHQFMQITSPAEIMSVLQNVAPDRIFEHAFCKTTRVVKGNVTYEILRR